jgi:hypothetical protein
MMSCVSLPFIEMLLIWLVILIAVVSAIQLLIPYLTNLLGASGGGVVAQLIRIVLWAVVAIVVIKIIFMLLGCVLTGIPHVGKSGMLALAYV